MNAYELHNAAFDAACDHAEETVTYIKDYADGAFDIMVSDEVALRILECRSAWKAANENNGNWENNYYYHVRAPLENIDL